MDLDVVRTEAQDAARASKWVDVLALEPQLRTDDKLWLSFWGPICAVAAAHVGQRERGRALLSEVTAGGFFQPELLGPELEAAFGGDQDYPELLAAIVANTPPPPLTMTAWPTVTPVAPYTLFRAAADREPLLRERIPAPLGSAWATARAMLAWVTDRWEHTSLEHCDADAIEILDRVDRGSRFACLEYSIVLCQALNAVGIPSRRILLRSEHAHAALGGGHVDSEAWIDDLGRWVVLDGQNGLYWVDDGGSPMSLLDLHGRFRAGAHRPDAVCLSRQLSEADLDDWWRYFASVRTNEVGWSASGYVPYFEREAVGSGLLVASPEQAYPDFTEVGTTTVVRDGAPAVLPVLSHPYAVGYRVTTPAGVLDLAPDEPWPLPLDATGERSAQIATRTPYGVLRPYDLRFTVSG